MLAEEAQREGEVEKLFSNVHVSLQKVEELLQCSKCEVYVWWVTHNSEQALMCATMPAPAQAHASVAAVCAGVGGHRHFWGYYWFMPSWLPSELYGYKFKQQGMGQP
jgi:hypothetical protein